MSEQLSKNFLKRVAKYNPNCRIPCKWDCSSNDNHNGKGYYKCDCIVGKYKKEVKEYLENKAIEKELK